MARDMECTATCGGCPNKPGYSFRSWYITTGTSSGRPSLRVSSGEGRGGEGEGEGRGGGELVYCTKLQIRLWVRLCQGKILIGHQYNFIQSWLNFIACRWGMGACHPTKSAME